jgi:hypothetical protein
LNKICIVKSEGLKDRHRLKGNRRSIEGGDRVYMERKQEITLTPDGENKWLDLFSAGLLFQFSVSEIGE